jgi:hypothetical protein
MNPADKFNTSVDIKLREWAESELPAQSIRAGREALKAEFTELMARAADSDVIYDPLKRDAVDEALGRHQWEDRAQDVSYFLSIYGQQHVTLYTCSLILDLIPLK